MRYLHSGGFQEIALSDRPWPGDPNGVPALRFDDALDARAFLRRLLGDPDAIAGLRALLARASVSTDRRLDDDELIGALADALRAGTITVELTTRMRPTPYGGVSDEPEEEAPEREETADQDVEFEITDPFDDPFPDLEWVLIYPDGKTQKTGKLGKDGIVKESSVPPGTYRLAFKLVSGARWGTPALEVGKAVKVEAEAPGFDPGTAGKVEIFDARSTDQKPLAKLAAKVSDKRVLEGSFTPDEALAKRATSGALVFRAKIGDALSMSAPAPLFLPHTFELSADQGPLADTEVVARFSDGHQARAKSKGGKVEIPVPAGQTLIWVHLPEHPGAEVEVEPEGEAMRSYLQPPAGGESGGGGIEMADASTVDDVDDVDDVNEEAESDEAEEEAGDEVIA
jgi:hypothetical protein